MTDTEIVRTIKLDDKTIEVHIHLTEGELRRLLIPIVVQAFADELRRRSPIYSNTITGSTEYKS
jgi:hypothetical protein